MAFDPTGVPKSFHTQLTGIFGDETNAVWGGISGTNFTWSTNAVTGPTSGGILNIVYDSVVPGQVLPPVIAGGVSNVQYDVGGAISPAVRLSAVSGSGTFGGTGTLKATLSLKGSPLAGATVTFTLTVGTGTQAVGSAVTNANGVATLPGVSLAGVAVGNYPSAVAASVTASATYTGSGAVGGLTVNAAHGTIKPPLVSPIPTQTVDVGQTLQLNVSGFASDPNTPALPLTYSLGAGAPAGVGIGPTTGVLTWHVGPDQHIGTYGIMVQVSDNSSPPLSASELVSVSVVDPGPPPMITGAAVVAKKGFSITLTFNEAVDPATATNANNYVLTEPAKKPRSKKKPAPPPTRINLSVNYNQATDQVVLTGPKKVKTKPALTLTVIGTAPNGIAKTDGLQLAGSGGQPGTNYVASVTSKSVAPLAVIADGTTPGRTAARLVERHSRTETIMRRPFFRGARLNEIS
jgi:hypothetical protein